MEVGYNALYRIYALVLGFVEVVVVCFQIFSWKEVC